jgi:hypothetical protein
VQEDLDEHGGDVVRCCAPAGLEPPVRPVQGTQHGVGREDGVQAGLELTGGDTGRHHAFDRAGETTGEPAQRRGRRVVLGQLGHVFLHVYVQVGVVVGIGAHQLGHQGLDLRGRGQVGGRDALGRVHQMLDRVDDHRVEKLVLAP